MSDEEDKNNTNTPLVTLMKEKEKTSRSLINVSSDDEGPIAGPSYVTKLSVADQNKSLRKLRSDISPEKASGIGGDQDHLERFLENSLGQEFKSSYIFNWCSRQVKVSPI